jgi:hypothetical protein
LRKTFHSIFTTSNFATPDSLKALSPPQESGSHGTPFTEDFESVATFGKRVRTDSHRLSLSTGIITPPSKNEIAAPSPIPRPGPGSGLKAALIPFIPSTAQSMGFAFLPKGSYPEPVEMTDLR